MSIEEQVENAKKVKRAESFIIRDVVTIRSYQKVSEAFELMQKNSISGLPVVEGEDTLVGILTRRDVNFADQGDDVKSVMTSDVKSAGTDVTIEEAKKIMHHHRVEKLPVVNNNRKLLGLITIKDVYSRERNSLASRDSEGRLLVGAAISPHDLERAKALEKYVDVLVSDVAHFHNVNIIEAAKKLTREVGTELIIGNIGTAEATRDSVTSLDGKIAAIRAGVGSGSICVTSEVTKAGAPTLFAVAQIGETLDELGLNVPIIADGGIRAAGDAALALSFWSFSSDDGKRLCWLYRIARRLNQDRRKILQTLPGNGKYIVKAKTLCNGSLQPARKGNRGRGRGSRALQGRRSNRG